MSGPEAALGALVRESTEPLAQLVEAEARRLLELARDMEYYGGTPAHLAARDALRRAAATLQTEAVMQRRATASAKPRTSSHSPKI